MFVFDQEQKNKPTSVDVDIFYKWRSRRVIIVAPVKSVQQSFLCYHQDEYVFLLFSGAFAQHRTNPHLLTMAGWGQIHWLLYMQLVISDWEVARVPVIPCCPVSSRCTSCCNRWASSHQWWAGLSPQTTRYPDHQGWAASPQQFRCGPGRNDQPRNNPGRRSTAAWWWNSVRCTFAERNNRRSNWTHIQSRNKCVYYTLRRRRTSGWWWLCDVNKFRTLSQCNKL